MKKLAGLTIIIAFTIGIYKYLNADAPLPEDDFVEEVITQKGPTEWSAVEEKKEKVPKKITKMEKPKISKVEGGSAVVKQEFKERVSLAKKAVEQCRRDLGELLPKDFIENFESDFTNIEEIVATLDSFYEIVRKKYAAMREVNDILISHAGTDLGGDEIYNEVKELKDCGEFEEHSLMSIILENYFDQEWNGEQKKAVITTILNHYSKVMKEPVDLIHLNVKIGSLYEFVNNDFLPSKYREEIRELQKMGHNAQEALRTFLPQEYNPNEKLSAEATRNLKERERDEVESLKSVFVEFLSRANDEIASAKMEP